MFQRLILFLTITIFLFSCSKEDAVIYKPVEKTDPYVLYNEGLKAFEKMISFLLIRNFQRPN